MAMAVRYTNFAGRIIAERRNGVRKSYGADSLGSTIALYDDAGATTDTFEYWPYGEVRTRTGSTPTPFQYVGTLGYYSDLTGNIYVRARSYQPKTTRWMSVDPLWPRQPAFSYAGTSPISSFDPNGLWHWDWGQVDAKDKPTFRDAIGRVPTDEPDYLNPDGTTWLTCLECQSGTLMRSLGGIGDTLGNRSHSKRSTFQITVEDPGHVWPNRCSDESTCAYTDILKNPPGIVICRRALLRNSHCGPLHCIIAHELIHTTGAKHSNDLIADAAIYNCVRLIPGCERYTPINVGHKFRT